MLRNAPRTPLIVLVALAAAVALPSAAAAAQEAARGERPQQILPLTVRSLDRTAYVELARRWKVYIQANGPSAEALVNLGRALDYAGDFDAAIETSRRAARLYPGDPEALVFFGKMMMVSEKDPDAAAEALEHCIDIAPDHGRAHTMLATFHLRRGDFKAADKIFGRVFARGFILRPLQDFAYNLLVGLPAGAVLVTNGDSDTFPPLVLQAGKHLRPDVAVVNLSLLNLEAYAKGVFERFPAVGKGIIAKAAGGQPSAAMRVKAIIEKGTAPVYLAPTVAMAHLELEDEPVCDGLVRRIGKEGLSADASARLFLERFRLDSATDWTYAWRVTPSVGQIMRNYVSAAFAVSEREGIDPALRTRLLERALEMCEFHDWPRLETNVRGAMRRDG